MDLTQINPKEISQKDIDMKLKLIVIPVIALTLVCFADMTMAMSPEKDGVVPSRPEGPCDIYADGGAPCAAAHSSTRALYASYNGPLYQVMRMSDGNTLDIGVVQADKGDAGGYADASAQDTFCANTYCWITTVYDQSVNGNHLDQAPRGAFIGPAMGGFNNLPIADMAPVTVMGHKVYGVFIAPDMGLRQNDTRGIAVDDQAEGQYWVINGHHFNDGCCFDYGNAETDSRDDGDGTMETTYYGNASLWYVGKDPGPWIMTDQENNLVGCVNESPDDKYCPDLPSIHWRFVTATADGKPHHWRALGGDAQQGDLHVMFEGPRIINDRNSYDPMRKQGAIVLGNGGDNNNYSQGTFYEAAMTAPGTYPSEDTYQAIQANIVAAGYDVARLSITPTSSVDTPPGLQTFSPDSSQNTTVTYTNTTGSHVSDLQLRVSVPERWKSVVLGSAETYKEFTGPIAPGESVSATYTVTSGPESYNGDLLGQATWTNAATGQEQSESASQKVRNVSQVKINEFRISSGTNLTNTFIELHNASDKEIDLSNWSLTQHQTQLPIFSSLDIPKGTKLAAGEFYLFALSTSGLDVPAEMGDSTIYLRNTKGLSVGDEIEIGTGTTSETHKIESLSTPPVREEIPQTRWFWGRRPPPEQGTPTTVWQPLPDGPVITIPKGSTNIPVENVDNFEVGQKMAIGYGASYPAVAQSIEKYEVVTVTAVGKPGRQSWLTMDAKAGDTNIKVSEVDNISVGDKIRLDIDSEGHGIEWVTITGVGTASSRGTFMGPLTDEDDPGTGLDLAKPLKFDHASNMPFSARGTGISFEPATAFDHSSNEPVLPLVFAVELNKPLANNHDIHAVVHSHQASTAGYQGTHKPDQWFGGPALAFTAGNMVLRDAMGNVVDSLNYGELVDPWASEGYQGISGAKELGCFTASPASSRDSSRNVPTPESLPDRSAGRYPDGNDNDSNCLDFSLQKMTSLALTSIPGSNNIKVTSVADFSIGQKMVIGVGQQRETRIITSVGTAGGAKITTESKAGDTIIPVESIEGFSDGQTITIGSGSNQENAVIVSATQVPFWLLRTIKDGSPTTYITVNAPLVITHDVDELVSGSGISFATPLTGTHDSGTYIVSHIPTPGEPNLY